MTIEQDVQKSALGTIITLYRIDFPEHGQTFYVSPSARPDAAVVFNGITYAPIPVQDEGMGFSSKSAPRPTITIANIDGYYSQLVDATADDLRGATVTRTKTLEKYLDNGAEPDPAQLLSQDTFYISRVASNNRESVEFELMTPGEAANIKLPSRQAFRSFCSYIYRRYNTTTAQFENSATTNACPYVGANYFTEKDAGTADPAEDNCSKQLSGCKLRFPDSALPYQGFPSMPDVFV